MGVTLLWMHPLWSVKAGVEDSLNEEEPWVMMPELRT